MEKWKDFRGTGYFISNTGLVKNKQGKFLTGSISYKGYRRLKILNTGTFYVHRMVAEAFIPTVYGKTHVNHINGKKLDNMVENLEWCNSTENNAHAIAIGIAPAYKETVVFDINNTVLGWFDTQKAALKFCIGKKKVFTCDSFLYTETYGAEIILKYNSRVRKKPVITKQNTNAKLTDDQVREIRNLAEDPNNYPYKIAMMYGVYSGTIDGILNGKTYKKVL